jgi:Reverse transcriptase (RNA-dependent DNA polymerase)
VSDREFVSAYVSAHANVTAQMSAKKGLAVFREEGASALMKELSQVVVMEVMSGCDARELTRAQKQKALRYLMFLKEKRCGRIKGRGCIDGRKQRLWKNKEDTTSPTVSIEALLLSCMIDARENRDVATIDIPVAFMQAFIDELVHVKFDGELIDLICQVDPSLSKYVAMENGKRVLYTKLNKALYGTLQASRLFWERLSAFLIEDNGFERNPYDFCVVNKLVNGKQLTIVWYVDDLKISHVETSVVDDMIGSIKQEFGQKLDVTVRRGKIHDYLGLRIDFSEKGRVILSMYDFIAELLKETPEELLKGPAKSPASNYLFHVNAAAQKLDNESAVLYHHLTAKLLYLSKRTRPDLLPTVSFLCTRVQAPDVDDWKKLGRCLTYLRDNANEPYILSMDDGCLRIRWWVDASYGVHPDLKGHTGATMSMGRGCMFSLSRKQKLNTRSSTEAELVGVDDAMSLILWTRLFLQNQGYTIEDNLLYQDNQSAMLLEKNGKMSSGKRTRHLDIRFFFVTDNVEKRHLRIEYCPTDDMIGDFFSKPLQGSKFIRFRGEIMGSTPIRSPPMTEPVHKECIETSDPGIPSKTNVEADPATLWTEVVRKKRKKKTDVLSRMTRSNLLQ